MPSEKILTSTVTCLFSRPLASEHNAVWWNVVWGKLKILHIIFTNTWFKLLFLEGKQKTGKLEQCIQLLDCLWFDTIKILSIYRVIPVCQTMWWEHCHPPHLILSSLLKCYLSLLKYYYYAHLLGVETAAYSVQRTCPKS